MPNCPPLYVSAPEVVPYNYGLFSIAQFPAASDPHWRCGVQWESFACDPAQTYPIDQCEPGDPLEKEFTDGVLLDVSDPFVVYGNYLCRLPGRSSEAEIRQRVTQSLLLGEQRAVERAVWTGEAGNTPFLADPAVTVLNANNPPALADAMSMAAGIAALEECAAQNYAGNPVIHGPRGAIALMSANNLLVRSGNQLTTWAGTPFAGYGGSPNTGPDGSVAPPGTAWLYVTGPVAIRRSEIFIVPDTIAAALNRTTNEVTVLAEREYSVIFDDCARCAVLITLSCRCC